MNPLQAVLNYRNQGFSIIPIIPKDKRPLIAWEPYQTEPATETQIRDWWGTEFPGANVGVVTGQVSGLVVIDLDCPEAKDKLKELLSQYDLTSVPRSRTGEGWQLFFQHPGVSVQNRAGVLPGLDVRGDGGYVVAPPSIHPNGRVYKWEVPIAGELPKLPVELFKLISSPVSNSANGYRERSDTARALDGVPEGQRDETLFRLACKLRSADVPEGMAEALILEAARNCQPPFPERQALEKISNTYRRYEPRRNGAAQFVSSPIENKPCAINFPLQTWGAFLNTDFSELPYTIEGLAVDSGLVVFHGRGKDGKSTLLIHACRAVASGRPFLGRATQAKPVVYLNYEMGFGYLQKLFREGGPCPDDAYILNRPEPVLQIPTVEAIMRQVGRPGVMVVDSFRGAFRLVGDAENSAGGAGLILCNIQDLAVKNKWLVIVVHHRNRGAKEGTDSISGTSDWIAAPDVIWTWSRRERDKPGVLSIEGRLPPVEPLAVQLSPRECVCMGTIEESAEESDKAVILKALTQEGQEAKVIAEGLDKPASTVRKRLEALYSLGKVNREGTGKKGDPYLYSKNDCAQNILLREETKPEAWEEVV